MGERRGKGEEDFFSKEKGKIEDFNFSLVFSLFLVFIKKLFRFIDLNYISWSISEKRKRELKRKGDCGGGPLSIQGLEAIVSGYT